jgi:Zn-dependent M28 family amino/carboxypeptidase
MRKIVFTSLLGITLAACTQQAPLDKTGSIKEGAETVQEAKLVSQASDNVNTLIDMALNGSYAYDITESLTTEIGPRMAGSENEARARVWAVEKFKAIGLENVRVEEFTIPGWERGIETAEIISPYPQQLYITSLGNSVSTSPEGIEAEIAYFPTFEDLESAPEGGLDGKIVFISGRMKKAHDGAGYGPANRKRQRGATEAGKRGALAVVIRSVGTDSHRFPHTGNMRYDPKVAPIPIGALSAPDADQLERTLERGETIRLKLVLTPRKTALKTSGNVIGDIIGSEKPDEIILISGHLDSWDLGTGAIDDGAGIGISAGAAQIILDAGFKPKRTIRVVAFGAEEVGLLGGFSYAKTHKDELKNHVIASESDFGAERVYALRTSVSGPARAALEDVQKSIAHLGIKMEEGPTSGGPDIIPLFRQGVPAFRLQQDGTDYFDFHHTPDDTFDKIDPEAMRQNVAAWAATTWMLSEADVDFRSGPDANAEMGGSK